MRRRRQPTPLILRRLACRGRYLSAVAASSFTQNALAEAVSQRPGSADMLQWLLALCVVLLFFFGCIWLLRQLTGVPAVAGGLRVLGAIALGTRERVVLLQAGRKQLVLGVTPQRIETLLVLEGEDCLPVATNASFPPAARFAEKLREAMRRQSSQ